jgi:hypothetical protein
MIHTVPPPPSWRHASMVGCGALERLIGAYVGLVVSIATDDMES